MAGLPWEKSPEIGSSRAKEVKETKKMPWDDSPRLDDMSFAEDIDVTPYAKALTKGGIKGILEIPSALIDLSTGFLRSLGFAEEEQVLSSDWVNRKVEEIIGKSAETPTGEVLERTGEEIGAVLPPSAWLFKAAKGVPATAKVIEGPVKQMWRSFKEPIQRAPGRAALAELGATTTSGAGAGVAQQVAPDSPLAETTGQVVGGVIPTAITHTPSALILKYGKKILSRFSTKAQHDMAREVVEKAMGGTITPEAIEGIKKAQDYTQRAPGFQPTTAEATRDPSLLRTQENIEGMSRGAELNKFIKRRVESGNAIENFRQSVTPQGDIDPEYVIEAASGKLQNVGNRIEIHAAKNLQDQKDLAEGLPVVDRMKVGEYIRDKIYKAKHSASLNMSARSQELGLNERDLSEEYMTWLSEISEKYKLDSRFSDKKVTPEIYSQMIKELPEEIAEEISEEVLKEPEQIITTFLDIKAIRERITDDLIDSLGAANPKRGKVRFLTRLKKDIDQFWNDLDPVLGEQYAQFRKEYFENYIKPFESGAIFKAKNKDGTGFFKVRNEQVAGMFLDNPSASKQFYSIFKDDPEMMQAFEMSVWDQLRRDVAPDGIVDQKKLKRWRHRHSDTLKELPEIGKNVSNIQNVQDGLVARQLQLAARKERIENKVLAKQLHRYTKGATTSEQILNNALKNPMQMASLKSFIKGNPDAKNALTRIVWERATSGNSQDVYNFVNNHRKSLTVLFGKQHFKDIEDVVGMRAMLELTPTPKGEAYTPMPMEEIERKMGMKFPSASTRYYAFMSGRLAKSYLVGDIARAAIYSKGKMHAEELFKAALYDPMVAREMANSIRTQQLSKARAKRLWTRVFALGLPYTRKTSPEEQEKPQ